MQGRDKKGRFGSKTKDGRKVRSMRVGDEAWDRLGKKASERGITRADLIEEFAMSDGVVRGNIVGKEILEEALKLKANAGGAIKKKIREYLLFHESSKNL